VVIPQDLRAVLGVVNGGPVAFITNRAGRVEIEAAMVDPGNSGALSD
jgi:bifunctional DNA-binding transcriptional regulator/antitoxin component of YhaV-PrlF toxin-antitoxin module